MRKIRKRSIRLTKDPAYPVAVDGYDSSVANLIYSGGAGLAAIFTIYFAAAILYRLRFSLMDNDNCVSSCFGSGITFPLAFVPLLLLL